MTYLAFADEYVEAVLEGEKTATIRYDLERELELGQSIRLVDASGSTFGVATVEDVERAVRERQEQRGERPTFRADVEGAVYSVADSKQFAGGDPAEVAAEKAHEIGAPTEGAYRRARSQIVTSGDQVAPADVLDDPTAIEGVGKASANAPAVVIRDADGDAVGVTGARNQEVGERMADEIGAEYMSVDEVNDSIRLDQREGEATLTLRGRPVGEVDVS